MIAISHRLTTIKGKEKEKLGGQHVSSSSSSTKDWTQGFVLTGWELYHWAAALTALLIWMSAFSILYSQWDSVPVILFSRPLYFKTTSNIFSSKISTQQMRFLLGIFWTLLVFHPKLANAYMNLQSRKSYTKHALNCIRHKYYRNCCQKK